MKKVLFFSLLLSLCASLSFGQVSLTNSSPSVTIDFSASTPSSVGTNPTSAYTGSGFEPNPTTAGRLNSNAWAVTGWTDGNLPFGGTATAGDYARGTAGTAVTTGGFYAYTGSPGSNSNPIFWIQQATNDFDPGTLTLRLKNDGTTAITSLTISYNVYYRNDAPRSSKIQFQHSSDDLTYTTESDLDVTTPQSASFGTIVLVDDDNDSNTPSRAITLSSLNILPGNLYYLRWNFPSTTGTGARDELGLDDIQITATFATPLSNYSGPPSGISSGTYNNVTFTSDGAFPAGTTITVNGTLQLNDHAIDLNGGSITMGVNGVVLPGTGPVPQTTDVGRVFNGQFTHTVDASTVPSAKAFPLGTPTARRYAAVQYTSARTSGGTLTATATESPAPAQNFTGVLPVSVTVPFYWTIDEGGGLSGGTYNLALTADNVPGVLNPTALRILKRPTGGGPWQIQGTPLTVTFSGGTVAIAYGGLSGFSEFSIGSDPNDNPLPVELMSFRGTVTSRGVALAWSTASERNNAGFILLRNGEPIASYRFSPELRGKGTTTSTTNYAFLDANVETGQTYTYQLRSVDFDGTVHDYAQRVTVEVREPISPPRYSYNLEQNYPNPFNPTTNIRYSIQQTGLVTLKVYDLLGREVATLVNEVQPPGNYEVQFNASTRTSSGIYIYRLQSGNFTRTMKMMLVK